LGEGVEDTRRRVLQAELDALGAAGLRNVMSAFGQARLLAFDRDPTTRGPTVEVAHEALLREWPHLQGWLDDSRDDVRWQRRLAAGAREWLQVDRDDGFLLRGSRLEQFHGWAARAKIALTQDEQDYLEASVKARDARQAEEEARRQRELDTARKLASAETARAEEQSQAAGRLRRSARYLTGALVVAAILAVLALSASRQSNLKTKEAEANFQLAVTSEAAAITSAELAAQAADAEATAAAEAQTQQAIAEEQREEAREAYSQSLAAHAQTALESGDTVAGLALALAASNMDQPPALSQRILRQAAYAPGPRRQFQVAELFPDVDGRIYSLAMSPVAQEALIGFEDGTLILWDVATESEIKRLEGHTGTVRRVAFAPDGQTALSGSSDRSVILWDLKAEHVIRRFEGHDGWVRTVAFSPDGKTAVSGGFVGDTVSAVSNPGQLILWDLASGQEIRRFGSESGRHPSGVVAAAFTPDGRAIMASSGFFANVPNEYSLMLWDVETGEKIHDFPIDRSYDNYSLAISPDGKSAVTGNNSDEVNFWDLDTGQRTLSLAEHTGNLVTSIAYTPDGRRALSGDGSGLVILWDLDSGQPLLRTGVQVPAVDWHADDAPVLNLAMSHDGRTALSSAQDGTLVLWDLVDAGEIRRFTGHKTDLLLGVAFAPDGKRALTAEWGDAFNFHFGDSNLVRSWDVETGEELRVFEGHTAGVVMIAVSADGRQTLTGSQDGTIRLWDLETGEEIRQILAHNGGVFAVALSADGRLALSGSISDDLPDSGIALWDLESGQLIRRFVDYPTHSTFVAFNPDGRTTYASSDWDESGNGFGLYDLENGRLSRGFAGPPGAPRAVHPDGRSIFLWALGTVIEWDLEADREIRAFGQQPGARTMVQVSQDGRLLLISTASGVMSLWDLETGQEIRRFSSDGACLDIDMSPDGTMAITPGGGGTAILWDLTLPVEMDEVHDWIKDNRHIRELSCEERALYQIPPLCEDD
jgi:WD40 repeat protein